LGEVLTTPHLKKLLPYETANKASDLNGFFGTTPATERDRRFGIWNMRSTYRSESLITLARESAKYKLAFVGVQEVRWNKEVTVRAGEYTFFYSNRQENHQLETGFFVHQRIISAIKSGVC
jgi:hypothetical protein